MAEQQQDNRNENGDFTLDDSKKQGTR